AASSRGELRRVHRAPCGGVRRAEDSASVVKAAAPAATNPTKSPSQSLDPHSAGRSGSKLEAVPITIATGGEVKAVPAPAEPDSTAPLHR
ncbi:unnamed protein product, partial [Urochloa humidicola]